MNLASILALTLLSQLTSTSKVLTMTNITRPDPAIPLAPSPLPDRDAMDSVRIIRALKTLSRSNISRLKLIKKIPLEGDLWEPEGIVRLASPTATEEEERFWVSAGEYTTPTSKYPNGEWRDGTDRTAGAGFAHFVVFDGRGKRLGDWVVSKEGDIEYHNGGIDYDGEHIWATLSQYRPNSTGTVVRIDPAKLEMEKMFTVADHQGGIVSNGLGRLTTLNWGGRKATTWSISFQAESVAYQQQDDHQHPLYTPTDAAAVYLAEETVNPSHWIDYQDCRYLCFHGNGDSEVMLCSGIATLAGGVEVGGLALVDTETMVPVWEVPFMERTEAQGVLMTKNPMDVAWVDGRVRLYFAPEEGNSVLYVYELQ